MNAFDRRTNLRIIQELRNLERTALDTYIEKVIIPLGEGNPSFNEALYKDILYVLEGVDEEGDGDLVIEDGDFVMEDGDLKVTGYQTRLHETIIWLHIEGLKKIDASTNNPEIFLGQVENFNRRVSDFTFTSEYRAELDKVRRSLRNERRSNYRQSKWKIQDFLNFDFLELKPNIMGVGLNVNELINRLRKRN